MSRPGSAGKVDRTIDNGWWTIGNQVRLLENGEAFYPAVIDALNAAESEILIETFILAEDDVGATLRAALIAAAERGVRVTITVDGYGSPDLSLDFLGPMVAAGVDFRSFDPRPRLFGLRTNALRRLHRKIIVVDKRRALIGGLNISMEHLDAHGPTSKQDYAVEVTGPVVLQMHSLARALIDGRPMPRARPLWRSRARRAPINPTRPPGAAALLVWRDNDHHQDDIEIHYRRAIRMAQHEVLIANAYFFPGYRLIRELRNAACRGVQVRLILQGRTDHPLASWAARALYTHLIQSTVCIHEYTRRPLHAKVAVIDGHWSTVGSSNLDPASLSLNLEANLILDDIVLAEDLRRSLLAMIDQHCIRIVADRTNPQPAWQRILGYLTFHLTRLIPAWSHWLPTRRQAAVPADITGPATDPLPHDGRIDPQESGARSVPSK